jgi:hypothetical protein
MGSGSAKKARRKEGQKGKKKGRKGKKGRKAQSEKGLRYFHYGLLLYIIALVILLIAFISFLRIMPTIMEKMEEPESVTESEVAAMGGSVTGFCLGALIFLIGLLLLFLGLLALYSGRNEFKKTHTDSMDRGILFIIIGIIVNFIGGAIGGSVGHASGVVSAVFMGLGLMYLIYEISDERGKKILLVAVILNVIMGVIIAAGRIWMYSEYDLASSSTTEGFLALNNEIISFAGLTSLTLIPMIVYFTAYRRLYVQVRNREVV